MRQSYLFYLRCLAILGQSLTIGLVHFGLGLTLPLTPLLMILLVLVFANIHLAYYLKHSPHKDTDDFILIQLTLDMLALATLLYFTGGAENPFIFLFLLPLVIAAVMLPIGYAMALFVLSIFLFTRLMFDYVPLATMPNKFAFAINLHVLGMWLCFVLSAVLIVSFIAYLAYQVRQSQQQMARMQEIQHRQEQILALGTLAAGTAHELGTPLATIMVLAHELKMEVTDDLKPDMDLLCQQVAQCKQILMEMTQRVEQAKNQELNLISIKNLVNNVKEKLQILRPTIQVKYDDFQDEQTILITADATLEQAILNLLNNAADASADAVELWLKADTQSVYISVADRGLGMSEEILKSLGQDRISTKGEQGMGIGLLLANATLERLGGEIRFIPRDGGGMVVQVVLPIYQRMTYA